MAPLALCLDVFLRERKSVTQSPSCECRRLLSSGRVARVTVVLRAGNSWREPQQHRLLVEAGAKDFFVLLFDASRVN